MYSYDKTHKMKNRLCMNQGMETIAKTDVVPCIRKETLLSYLDLFILFKMHGMSVTVSCHEWTRLGEWANNN